MMQQAKESFLSRDYAKAEKLCREELSTRPNSLEAMHVLGLSRFEQGSIEEGIKLVIQSVVGAKTNANWFANLGDLWQRVGNMQMAFQMYKTYLELSPDGLPEDFSAAYSEALAKTNSAPFPLTRRQRFHSLTEQLKAALADTQQGDVAECGCFRGHSTWLIAHTLRQHKSDFTGNGLHVFDSFEGLSDPQPEDTEEHDDRVTPMTTKGRFAASLEEVQAHLSDFPDITYYPGWLPASLEGIEERTYRFVHVDVDLYEPTRGAFEYFFPRLETGGRLVSDDYNWPGARKAVDEFAASLPEDAYHMETTPYHQAVIIKRQRVFS